MTLLSKFDVEAFRNLLWGDVDPTSYPNIKATIHCVRDPMTLGMDFTLCVKFQPVTHFLSVSPNNWTGGHTFVVPTQPEEIVVRNSLHERTFMMLAEHGAVIFINEMRNKLWDWLPRLWEMDPRIGTCDQHYPTFPLFDHGAGDINLRRKYHGCALCDYAYGSGDGYRTWGGGNIGWVHPSCLLRARLGDGNI